MKKYFRSLALLLFFHLALAGNAVSAEDKSFAEIIDSVNSKFDRIETLSANVTRISYKANSTVEERWDYFFQKPDKIRVDYLKPGKRFLVQNINKFVEYIPEIKKANVIDLSGYSEYDKKVFYEKVFTRVSLRGLRLGAVKKGDVKIKRVSLNEFDAYFIDSEKPKYQIWVDSKSDALIKHVIYDDDGEIVYSSEGEDFKSFEGGFLLPQKINIVLPEKEGTLIKSVMFLNNMKVNEHISESKFDIKLANDVEVIK